MFEFSELNGPEVDLRVCPLPRLRGCMQATEAFMATSYPTSKGHFALLYDNYLKAREVSP